MTMTSLEPTSRWAMRPSGETFDLVRPGMSRVVARDLEGVEGAERGNLDNSYESQRVGCIDRAREIKITIK